LLDNVADAAVESLDHAVGLRVAGRREAVFDAKRLARRVDTC